MIKDFFADVVFKNAKAITVNKNDDIAEAVAVSGNKIVYVGTNEGSADYIGKDTKVIDVNGRTLMPGFIDAHIHFCLYGLLDHGVINIDYSKAKSISDIKELIRQDAKTKKKGEWIKLSGYDHNKLADKRHPTTADLDEAAPDNPVQCTRCCAHMGVYNSLALKIGGVDSPAKFAPGEVVVDENGNLTGLLKETAHMYMSTKVEFSDEEILGGLKNCDSIMIENGITSVHDAGAYGALTTRLYQKACQENIINVRLRPMIFDMFGKDSNKKYIESFLETGVYTGAGNEKYRIGPVKIMTDGSSSGPSSATLEPYCHDPNLKGILVWNQEEADDIVMKAHKAGYQMTAHAVGDMAVTLMVNAYEKALKAYPRKDHRHRIEHCGITNPDLIRRIKELGIIPISNPAFITINGSDYNRFYGNRVDYMFALKSYLDEGIITAIGSDAPVTHPNPMYSLYGALNRADYKTKDVVGEMQKVGILDIIRMFTYNCAYSSFEEDIKGSLEEGKLADMIILSENILDYPTENIFDIKTDLTMIDGKIVYTR
ncbi:amidohydrolase [Anaerotignum faecicola]|nr:amidohydrolase [Anaerotignum faecicola]